MLGTGTGRWAALSLSAMAFGLGLTAAQAQTGEDGVIVVTAQKREQDIQDVPIAISAFTADALSDRGIASVADLANQLPGVKFGEFSATGTISIRGVGTTIVSGGGENSVATHIDGMFLSQPAALTMIQDDLGSIEVLRGPQGTLYGRNATAGVINFISAAPTDSFAYGLTLGAGDYDRRVARGFVSGPLSDTVRARLSLGRDDRGGYAENLATGQELDDLEALSGRISLDIDVTPTWQFDVRAFGRRDEFAGPVYDGFDPSFAVLPAPLAAFDPREVSSTVDYDSSKELFGVVATNALDTPIGELRSVTGYTDFTYEGQFDGIGAVLPVFLDRTLEARTFSQEFNLQDDASWGHWLVGLYYLQEDIDNLSFTDFSALFGIPSSAVITQSSERQSVSAFADVTVDLSDRWSAFGGLRASWETLDQQLTNINTTLGTPVTVCSPASTPQSLDDSALTGRLGLTYDIAPEVMAYGQVSRGYKPGGFSQSQCNNPFEAETVSAVELGYRSRFAQGRVTFNASVFYYDNENLQLEQATPNGIPVVNAPESHVWGAEAELFWRPTPAWRFNAAVTLLDAEYDSFINQDPLLGVAPGVSLAGVPLNNAPRFSGNVGAEYAFGIGPAGSMTLRGEASFTDDYNLREFDRPYTVQDGYTMLNAYAIWDSPQERVRLRAFVLNAADEDVLGGVLGFGGAIGSFLPPRTWGVELTLKN